MFPAAVQRSNCVPWMQIRTNLTIDNVLLPCVSRRRDLPAPRDSRHRLRARTIALTMLRGYQARRLT
jgi:hypothetical protein